MPKSRMARELVSRLSCSRFPLADRPEPIPNSPILPRKTEKASPLLVVISLFSNLPSLRPVVSSLLESTSPESALPMISK